MTSVFAAVVLPTTIAGWVALFLALLLAVVGLLDAWLAVVWGEAATISAVVREVSKQYPAVPLAVGLLVGHLFL
jgi:hypothetical protein